MDNIDNTIKFVSINIGLITISDSRNEENDKSGNLLKEKISNFGHIVYKKIIIPDDIDLIKKTVSELSLDSNVDAIITTGPPHSVNRIGYLLKKKLNQTKKKFQKMKLKKL